MKLHVVTDKDVVSAYLSSARTPLDKVRAAIHWLALHHPEVRILTGDYGVLARSSFETGDWTLDRRRRPVGVSPLGAVLLAYQPPALGADIADPAALALGVPAAYAEGLADGFDGNPTAHYLRPEYPLSRRLYAQGLEAGFELRFELTTRCGRCGSRHFKPDPCPLCEEREGDCS